MNKMMNDYYPELVDAAINGHKEIVRLLIDNGATIDKKNNKGYTPLMIAAILAIYNHIYKLLGGKQPASRFTTIYPDDFFKYCRL